MPTDISLIDSINQDVIKDLVIDHGEIILDEFISNETIKDIPVLGSFAKLYKVGLSYRDFIFSKKIVRFLYKLSEVPIEERDSFLNDINSDQDFKSKLGTKLMMLLDKFDEVEKADLLAKAFESYLKKEIDYKTFSLLTIAIERFALVFTQDFIIYYSLSHFPPERLLSDHLFNCGLLSMRDAQASTTFPKASGSEYKKNDLGYRFYENVINGRDFDLRSYLISRLTHLEIQPSGYHQSYENVPKSHNELTELIMGSEWSYPAKVGLTPIQISMPEGMIRRDGENSFYIMVHKLD